MTILRQKLVRSFFYAPYIPKQAGLPVMARIPSFGMLCLSMTVLPGTAEETA
jgi:hypothetical protein